MTSFSFLHKLIIKILLVTVIWFGISLNQVAFSKTDTTYSVEFRLNLSKAVSQHIFLPYSDVVFAVLDHSIQPLQLVPGPDYIYSGTFTAGLDSGAIYHYNFRINDSLTETVMRSFQAKPGIVTLSDWWNDDPANRTTFLVNMVYARQDGMFNPATDTVSIVGTMNNMQGSPKMQRVDTSMVYSYTYTLDPGTIARYKYRINADSGGLELLYKPDRIIRVPDTLLKVYNDFNNFNPAKRLITFRCNMDYYIKSHQFYPLSQYLDIAGNFNGWGANDVLFIPAGDSIFSIEKYLDTTWFQHGPVEFKFRINGDWNLAELPGKPNRNYSFHDTVNQNPNIFSCYYNNLDPSTPTPPWVTDVSIQGLPIYKKNLSGSYSYQNVNGIPEGLSTYRWLRSDNAQGLNAMPIDSAWKITHVVDTLDIGKWLVFEVTPKAASGDSATGKPVQVVTWNSISAWDVGIGEQNTIVVKVYPNPTDDFITVSAPKEIDRIEVINALNQSLLIKENIGLGSFKIQIGKLPTGFYLLKATAKTGQTGVVRVVKY
ncbi:MAG: T9SS type A sorting domain-containing protein [Bacteroidetes bacterium]|nr:T9SS type A sorting domain-containing protein [Bacteroidota bacterium]